MLRVAGFLAAQLALVLLLLELVARLFDPLGISYYPQTARYLDTLVRGELLGYSNRPGLAGRFYGARVEINSLGLRDRELPLRPPPGEFRVLFSGDSMPFGIGVEQDETMPAQLERIANGRAEGGQRYRVINLGVPSYNTEQERVQLETLGFGLGPRLVLLLFSNNDVEPRLWVLARRASRLVDFGQRSYALSLLFVGGRALRDRIAPPGPAVLERYREDAPAWLAVDRELTRIFELCRSRGIPFAVFSTNPEDSQPVRQLAAIGAREGFAVFALPIEIGIEWRNSVVDSHPDAEGSRRYAEELYARLLELGALRGRSS